MAKREPLLIGAESREGKAYRRFTGEMEEAALRSRALTDSELRLLLRQERSESNVK